MKQKQDSKDFALRKCEYDKLKNRDIDLTGVIVDDTLDKKISRKRLKNIERALEISNQEKYKAFYKLDEKIESEFPSNRIR